MNKSATESKIGTWLTRGCSRPVHYELIDKDGNVWGGYSFQRATTAAEQAGLVWPDQEQDEDRTGKGWDMQVVGAE